MMPFHLQAFISISFHLSFPLCLDILLLVLLGAESPYQMLCPSWFFSLISPVEVIKISFPWVPWPGISPLSGQQAPFHSASQLFGLWVISSLRIFTSEGRDQLHSPLYMLTGIVPGMRLVLKASLEDHERADLASSRQLWAIRALGYFWKMSWTSSALLWERKWRRCKTLEQEGSDGVSGLRNGEKACQSHNTPTEGREEWPFSTTCFYIRYYVGKVASSIYSCNRPMN